MLYTKIKPMQNLLNYQFHQAEQAVNQPTLVFIHGLFGDMNNLGIIARAFSEKYNVLRVDLRNHGQSFHSSEMNYALMAQDLYELVQALGLTKLVLIGHSMGGKTAMTFAAAYPQLVERLVVIDIAPVAYVGARHSDVFAGLLAVQQQKPASRQLAKPILASEINDEAVQQFMLKSFDAQSPEFFRFNVSGLQKNYGNLMDWQPVHCEVPCLFIRGGDSDYILPAYSEQILAQFPNATSFTISGANHWVHAEKPQFVVRAIEKFLATN